MKQKKTIGFYILFLIALIGFNLWVHFDYEMYDTPILRITNTDFDIVPSTEPSQKTGEKLQSLTGVYMNGKDKGAEVTFEHQYMGSGITEDLYKKGDEIFLQKNSNQTSSLFTILGNKRDTQYTFILSVFLFFLMLSSGKNGFFTVLTLTLNISLFLFALYEYGKGQNILLLTNILIVLFTSISLLLISGLHKKTYIAILSTIITLIVSMALFQIAMRASGGIDYAFMEYITDPTDLADIFFSQILLGGLGAIMDVAITEAAAINELIEKDPYIPTKALVQSGREVGYDVMGTMINVMLFTYISGSIPLIILKMNNDIRLHTIILWHMPMELYRFLIGSISILLTIPISLGISILLFKKGRRSSI